MSSSFPSNADMLGPPPSSASTSSLWKPTATLEAAVPPLPDSRAQSAHAAESAFRAANQDSFYHRPYDSSGGPKKLRARRTIDYFGEVGKWNLVSHIVPRESSYGTMGSHASSRSH